MRETENIDLFPDHKMFYIDYDPTVNKCRLICKFSETLDDIVNAFSDVNPASFFVKQYGFNVSSKISVINSFGYFSIGLYHDIVGYIQTEYGDGAFSLSPSCLAILKSQLIPFFNFIIKHKVDDFKVLNMSSTLELRQYQIDMIKSLFFIGKGRGLIESPTASGKSFLIANIIHNIEAYDIIPCKHIMIFVPGRQLVDQFYKDLLNYGYQKSDLTMFTSKVKNTGFNKIIITNRSYLFNHKEELPKIDVFICDEVHQVAPDSSSAELIETLNCAVKIGCSGTLPDNKYKRLYTIGLFGKIVHIEDIITLQNQGFLSKLSIMSICGIDKKVEGNKNLSFSLNSNRRYTADAPSDTDDKDDDNSLTFNESWNDEQTYVIDNCVRLYTPIMDIIQELPGNVLILFDRLSFGKDISATLPTGANFKNVWYIDGETKIPDREIIREKLENSSNNILFAQSITFSTGINIKNLPNIAFFFSGKGHSKVIQSIGRTLRLHNDKDTATLIDISFNFKYSQRHFRDRLGIYKKDYLKGSPDVTQRVYIN